MRRFHRDRGTAFLIVTHDHEVADHCDRVVHMVDGVVDSDTRRSDTLAPHAT
jgi:lipoprotein-releasing system ATP-binding protein